MCALGCGSINVILRPYCPLSCSLWAAYVLLAPTISDMQQTADLSLLKHTAKAHPRIRYLP